MSQTFVEESRSLIKKFLQTAVIIDDRISHTASPVPTVGLVRATRMAKKKVMEVVRSPRDEQHVETGMLVESFAEAGIICGALQFRETGDIDDKFIKTANAADITIIDWELEECKTGDKALNLISRLLEEDLKNPQRLRLINIYTGSNALSEISEKIMQHVLTQHSVQLEASNANLKLIYKSILILICAKYPDGLIEEHQQFAVNETELPEKLICEFTNSFCGILSNVAISSLTAIRESTHKLLVRFDRKYDEAYLTHRASLPKPSDSEDQLESLVGEEIKSILTSYNCVGHNASFSMVQKWFDYRYDMDHTFSCPDRNPGRDITLTRQQMLKCLEIGSEEAKFPTKKGSKHLYLSFSRLLLADKGRAEKSNMDFARLSVSKRRYEKKAPYLTMGTILQKNKDQTLWLCVQPKCDSVRLQDPTRFPLLPMHLGANKEDDTFPSFNKETDELMHVVIHPRECRNITFKSALVDKSRILPMVVKEKWVFCTTESSRFTFVTELKDEIAQNIMNIFAEKVSRVGINPSEWLRLKGKNNV